ncbi:MAG: hypothetical protein HY057_04745 [Rhodospirillales bacterium]|nr:hypothetical protein [Rhodospirillales bacterium]
MPTSISPELFWLAAVALLTAALWIPYTLQLIVQMGPIAAFWDPFHETPLAAPWAQRAKRAHTNAVEGLVVPLVRTLLFLVGFGCQIVLGGAILGWLR